MSRPRLEHCKRGHLLADTRRQRGDGTAHDCRACHNILQSQSEHRKERRRLLARGRQQPTRLDFAPMERLLMARGIVLSNVFNGTSLRRWRADGIPLFTADEIACRYGLHPLDVWGQEWFAA